jgi:hypothetical protein
MSARRASRGRSGEMPPLTRGATIMELDQRVRRIRPERERLRREWGRRSVWLETRGGGFEDLVDFSCTCTGERTGV